MHKMVILTLIQFFKRELITLAVIVSVIIVLAAYTSI